MPKPAEFLYECWPFEKDWQLVGSDKRVKDRKAFTELPYLLPPFHSLGLTLISEQKCVLNCDDGFCRIEFKAKAATAHMLNLQYELFKKDENNHPENTNLTRMVFNSRANEHFVFELRFPVTGKYKLIIYGGPYKSPALRLCEFLIHCKKAVTNTPLLPLACDKFGWGPGPVSIEAGLLMPSKPSGLIPVNKNDKKLTTEIKFQLRDDFVRKQKVTTCGEFMIYGLLLNNFHKATSYHSCCLYILVTPHYKCILLSQRFINMLDTENKYIYMYMPRNTSR